MCACAGEIVAFFLRGSEEEERRREGVKEGARERLIATLTLLSEGV